MNPYQCLWNVFMLLLFYQSEGAKFKNQKLEVRWEVDGKGYHRDVVLAMQGPPAVDISDTCDVCLLFKIPRGIYIDIYQMSNLQEFGGPQVYTPVEIDLEKAAHNSQSHLVYIYGTLKIQRNIFQKILTNPEVQNKNLEAELSFPLHLRYQKRLRVRTTVNVTLDKPQVLVRCQRNIFGVTSEKSAPCNALGSPYCIWNVPHTQFDQDKLIFEIPVGRKQDTELVITVTLIVTITSCAFLLYTIITKPISNTSSKAKQS